MSVERHTVDGPLVIGSGVAGLSVALALPRAVVVTAGWQGSTALAQGGIAAAISADDAVALHAADTISVSGELALRTAVDALTHTGPAAIDHLVDLGASFDRDATGRLALGREAGHARRRIVHAGGDATGAAVQRTLQAATAQRRTVEVLDGWHMLDLLRVDDRVTGVLAADPTGRRVALTAPGVVLATGGIGGLYRHTTNPPGTTGDALAAAARAGARLADLEFVQFHPTALRTGGDPLPLLTEALRGAGANLVDEQGRRFMVDAHPDAELAPRDVVARAIWHQGRSGGAYLDARGVPDLTERFPTAVRHATAAGLDPACDLLPVTPAAHFHMGGIDAGPTGQTSIPGLWAVGEAASTGVHGANRLASNSLLEGLVFGAATGRDVAAVLGSNDQPTAREGSWTAGLDELPLDPVPEIDDVRQLMWDEVGLVRSAPGLQRARSTLSELATALAKTVPGRVALENAQLLTTAALRRPESRGSHHRTDHPHPDPSQAARVVIEPIAAPMT